MSPINLKAHFDGQSIQLDEPFELAPNTPLLVTVLPSSSSDEQATWNDLGRASLGRAYGSSEPEYSDADVVP